ncbi:MAG: hypothetical protein GY948_20805 [Alphaproteobacteria bacterium]|nr:hypothetical protein [Alphaproteobacteria bacterium]
MTWIIDTVGWAYHDVIYPYLNISFMTGWLLGGKIPLIVSILVMNSLFLMNRLFNSAGAGNSDWNSAPSLVFQGGLIAGNIVIIAVDAAARGWL